MIVSFFVGEIIIFGLVNDLVFFLEFIGKGIVIKLNGNIIYFLVDGIV